MFERFFDEGLERTSYLVACPRTREAVVIDPRRDVEIYVAAARERAVTIRWVFQTHVHDNFACGARELVALGARAIVGPDAGLRYQHHYVTHGERMRIGDLSILFLHTPGHTPEHIAILASQPDEPVRLFTGDTLRAGDVGRPDADAPDVRRRLAEALHDSLYQRILPLDDRIHLLPSAGAGRLSQLVLPVTVLVFFFHIHLCKGLLCTIGYKNRIVAKAFASFLFCNQVTATFHLRHDFRRCFAFIKARCSLIPNQFKCMGEVGLL